MTFLALPYPFLKTNYLVPCPTLIFGFCFYGATGGPTVTAKHVSRVLPLTPLTIGLYTSQDEGNG